jgi:hypothetical protein
MNWCLCYLIIYDNDESHIYTFTLYVLLPFRCPVSEIQILDLKFRISNLNLTDARDDGQSEPASRRGCR